MRNHTTASNDRYDRQRGAHCTLIATWAIAFALFSTPPLWAIPSPDLVVNFFASAAQALGLLSVVLGGFAFSVRRRPGARTARSSGWGWAFRICAVLLLVSIAANILQYSARVDSNNTRLRTNLVRASKEQGKSVGDVSLKVLAFSDQLEHPNGVHTEELAKMIEVGRQLNLIDVREPEEAELGYIQSSWNIRHPDLRGDGSKLTQKGVETILLCFSGNRSSELCEEFVRDGATCRFLVGGYEKWISEGRSLQLAEARSAGELRELASYPNKDVLLDTPDVKDLVQNESAVFVDVRYPGDFKLGHLPGAINIPLRKMPTEELWTTLKELPKVPIIAACYDKRSSFYGEILGLRLHRIGYDFRGRYTVPHEYFVPEAAHEHVAKWQEDQSSKTLLSVVATPLRAALGGLTSLFGSLGISLVSLVLILRLLVLPLTYKLERDQIVQNSLAEKTKALKETFKNSPQLFSRAVHSLHRKENLTPVRNLVGTTIQITLFIVFFSVVNDAATSSTESFLWIPKLGSPDALLILPLLIGGLVFTQLRLSTTKRTRRNLVFHVFCGGLLFALTFKLIAAVNIYLAFNLALMLLQGQLTWCHLKRRQIAATRVVKDTGIVMLKDAHRVLGTGNKAIRLGELMEVGLPVPNGFAVTDKIFSREPAFQPLPQSQDDSALTPGPLTHQEKKLLQKAWKTIDAEKVAVRSSGLNEDGKNRSYAGIFESILNVRRDDLISTLEEVHSSLSSSRVSAYAGGYEERGGVLVQKMVDAEYAGVLFTEHPTTTGCCLVELMSGLGESLVRGTATPESYLFGRYSHERIDEKLPPISLQPLLELGRRAEDLYGCPQDIEWAYANDQFFLLQTRNITVSIKDSDSDAGSLERERFRLLELVANETLETAVYAQNELSELLPRPTPLSLDFMERLWIAGGSTDLACQSLGIPYAVEEEAPPYVNSVFGALYINRAEEARRLKSGPGIMASFTLARSADSIRKRFQNEFLPPFEKKMRLREVLNLSRLRLEELLDLTASWIEEFVQDTYVEADIINIAADFYLKTAAQRLDKHGLDSGVYLAKMPPTVVHQAMCLLPKIKLGQRDVQEFLDAFGHRAPHDYEFAAPRYQEDAELVRELVACAHSVTKTRDHEEAIKELGDNRILRLVVQRAQDFQVLKEEAKHNCLREFSTIRTLLMEVDTRLELNGGIFYLQLDELPRLSNPDFLDAALDTIKRRRADLQLWKELQLPHLLSIGNLERFRVEGAQIVDNKSKGVLHGKRVSGEKEVVGRVRVITAPEQINELKNGEIMVTRFMDPTWTPLFPQVGGVITEVGGWLSHAAIVAREYNVTATVGASGVMDELQNGDLVHMRTNGTIQKVNPVWAEVSLLRQGQLINAVLRNLNESGALIEVEEELKEGQDVEVLISDEAGKVEAEVVGVSQNGDGGYEIEFQMPIASPLLKTGHGPKKS